MRIVAKTDSARGEFGRKSARRAPLEGHGRRKRSHSIPPESQTIGLCARCRHARIVTTPRSQFWLCALAASDPRFARYPRLPMSECPGHEIGEPVSMGKVPEEGSD